MKRKSRKPVTSASARNNEFARGVRAAADIASQYDHLSGHDYRVSDCILGKLNVLARKPRRSRRMAERLVVTDYWDEKGKHRPYRDVMHGPNDQPRRDSDVLAEALDVAGARDGDEVIVLAVKTGRRPFGDCRVVWAEPHKYEREKKTRRKSA